MGQFQQLPCQQASCLLLNWLAYVACYNSSIMHLWIYEVGFTTPPDAVEERHMGRGAAVADYTYETPSV